MIEYRYRYVDSIQSCDGVTLSLLRYAVVRNTSKGAWVTRQPYMPWMNLDEMPKSSLRFVLDGSGKRYCHETRRQAWSAFKHRKYRQAAIAKLQANRAKWALQAAENIGDLPDFNSLSVNIPEVSEFYVDD